MFTKMSLFSTAFGKKSPGQVRSTEPVDRHVPLCMCAHRLTDPVDREQVCALCFSLVTGPVDR